MHFDYLEDFIKVVKCNSLTKASHELNISTPALSKRIKSIEDYFNCELFFRTSKGIYLTNNGKKVYEALNEVHNSLEKLKNQITNSQSYKFSLGMIPSFSLFKFNNQNNDFKSIATLTIENSTSILLEELNNGNIDVVVGDFTNLRNGKIYVKEIYTEEFIVVYSQKNKFKYKDLISIKDIENEKVYLQSPPCDTYNFVKENSLKHKLNISYMDYYESILANVKAGKGITLIPKSLATRIDSMYLHQKSLKGYKRIIGIASYSKSIVDEIYEHLIW